MICLSALRASAHRRASVLLTMLVVASVLAGCSAVSPYAARVNGHNISQSDLDSELAAILGNTGYLDSLEQSQLEVRGKGERTFQMSFATRVLTRRIFLELVHQEVVRRDLDVGPAITQARADVVASFTDAGATGATGGGAGETVFMGFPEGYRNTLVVRTAEVTVLQAALAKLDLTDASVQRYYDENQSQFRQTCVDHILVPARDRAAAVLTQVRGGRDFGEAARAESQDPGSAPSGGDLGCVAEGSLVPEFEAAMATLQPGVVSEPVQTEFGFHLIRVRERRVQPLSEVRDQVRARLLTPAQEDFNRFLTTALQEAKIVVNPRYGSFDKEGSPPGVVPPSAGEAPEESE